MKICALVPIKKNSRRLENKNFLNINNRPLSFHIFKTLLSIKEINQTYLYASDKSLLNFLPKGVKFLDRPKKLDAHTVKANQLFRYAIENIHADYIIIAHTTSPFLKSESILRGIKAIKNKKYTSAFGVLKHQTYSWYNNEPVNYDIYNMSQTQNLIPVYTETSGFYIFKKNDYLLNNTRISSKPYLVNLEFRESLDIDTLKDFNILKKFINFNESKKNNFFDLIFIKESLNKKLNKIKHISFDLDGVLINSLNLMRASWVYTMRELGYNYSFSEYKKYIGLPFDKILKNMKIKSKFYKQIESTYSEYSKKHVNKINVYKNVLILLKFLNQKNYKISIITSKNLERTKQIMNLYFKNIKFDTIITPDNVRKNRGKPYPDSLYLACSKLGVGLDQTLYIGDSYTDYEFSKNSGVNFIHAKWGYYNENYDLIAFDTISELFNFIKKYF